MLVTKPTCRACLKVQEESEQWNSLFAGLSTITLPNYEKFNMLTGLIVDPSCKYAIHICSLCEATLIRSFDFLLLCRKNNKILQEQLSNIDIKHKLILEPSNSLSNFLISDERNCIEHTIESDLKNESFDNISTSVPFEYAEIRDNLQISDGRSYAQISTNNIVTAQGDIRENKDEIIEECYKMSIEIAQLREDLEKSLHRIPKFTSCKVIKIVDNSQDIFLGKKVRKTIDFEEPEKFSSDTGNENLEQNEELEDDQYICDICGNSYKKRKQLEFHRHLHTGIKKFKCEVCDRRFAHRSYLTGHMLIHNGERKKYPCNFCKKEFSRQRTRRLHEKVHTSDYGYECLSCNKKFVLKSLLKRHMRIHNGERPYECKTCGKSFRRNHHLSQHFKTKAHRELERSNKT